MMILQKLAMIRRSVEKRKPTEALEQIDDLIHLVEVGQQRSIPDDPIVLTDLLGACHILGVTHAPYVLFAVTPDFERYLLVRKTKLK